MSVNSAQQALETGLISRKEAAERLQMDHRQLARLIAAGTINEIPGTKRIRAAEVKAVLTGPAR